MSWWNRTTQQCAVQLTGTQLTQVHNHHVLSHAFTKWIDATQQKQQEELQDKLAHNLHTRNILRRAIHTLHVAALRGEARRQARYAAVRMHYLSSLQAAWRGWRGFMEKRKEKMGVFSSAVGLHNKFVLQKCIEVWLV